MLFFSYCIKNDYTIKVLLNTIRECHFLKELTYFMTRKNWKMKSFFMLQFKGNMSVQNDDKRLFN